LKEFRERYGYCKNCYRILSKRTYQCKACGSIRPCLDFPTKAVAEMAKKNYDRKYYRIFI